MNIFTVIILFSTQCLTQSENEPSRYRTKFFKKGDELYQKAKKGAKEFGSKIKSHLRRKNEQSKPKETSTSG